MTKKKRLGRGLDALLSKPISETHAVTGEHNEPEGLHNIPVDLLQRGQYQPRVDMRQDTLEELAKSIQAQGVVQPIVARPISKSGKTQRYEIIAGERRWRAAQMAGYPRKPVVPTADGRCQCLTPVYGSVRRSRLVARIDSSACFSIQAIQVGLFQSGWRDVRFVPMAHRFEFAPEKLRQRLGAVTLDRQAAALRRRIGGEGADYNEPPGPQRP